MAGVRPRVPVGVRPRVLPGRGHTAVATFHRWPSGSLK